MLPSASSHPAADVRRGGECVDGQIVEDRRRSAARLDVGLQQSHYTSPLPSPDDLDRYVAHLPDAAERLMTAGELEQAHRHRVELRLVAIDEALVPRFYAGQQRAQWISLVVSLAYLGVMAFAISHGYSLMGAGGAAFGIAAVVWALRRASAISDVRPSGQGG